MSSAQSPHQPTAHARKNDFNAIWRSVLPPLISWTAAVCFVTFVGKQPGVICVTPVAWLMACWVGASCVARSRSAERSSRLKEAAIAGGILGWLQGLLFAALAPLMGDIKPQEEQKALVISAVMVVLGALISAALSVAVGAAQDRRLNP